MSTLIRIADLVLNQPLLLHPDKLAVIADVLSGRIGIDASTLEEQIPGHLRSAAPEPEASGFAGSRVVEKNGQRILKPYRLTANGTAVIDIKGSLVNRGAYVGASSGVTSYEGIAFQIAQALADEDVAAILYDVNSPGGQATGMFELAKRMRGARSIKPSAAIVNGMAASAAFGLASAAGRVISTESSLTGSVGVVMMHADYSRALDRQGITPTFIFAGDHKVDANPYEPLSKSVKNDLQASVDELYGAFVQLVADNLGIDAGTVQSTQARTFTGAEAKRLGLVHEIGDFDAALATHGGIRRPSSRSTRMSGANNETAFTHSQADVDAARGAGLEAGIAQGRAEGATAERTRIAAILTSDEAKGRETSAQHLAFNTALDADTAKATLSGLQAATAAAAPKAALENRTNDVGFTGTQQPAAPKAAVPDTASIYAARRKAQNLA